MKHRALVHAIADAATDELKHLLAPLVASELARQRAGGDSHAPPALPAPTRAIDRVRIRTRVEWSASAQLAVLTTITETGAAAITERVTALVRDALLAEKMADGTAQREFEAYRVDAKRVPAAHAEVRAQIAQLRDVDACVAAARARAAVQGLVASLQAKRLTRERRGRAA
jgi:hypothetical protein